MNGRRVIGTFTLALIASMTLAACGNDQSASLDATAEQIATGDSSLGTILVDDEGRTVYIFTQDSPGQSACEGDCLENWPPVEGELAAGEGADSSLLGTFERSDGTVQATYADRPLYYYAQDESAGDVEGQGVEDVWYVVAPDGEPIEKAPETGGGGIY